MKSFLTADARARPGGAHLNSVYWSRKPISKSKEKFLLIQIQSKLTIMWTQWPIHVDPGGHFNQSDPVDISMAAGGPTGSLIGFRQSKTFFSASINQPESFPLPSKVGHLTAARMRHQRPPTPAKPRLRPGKAPAEARLRPGKAPAEARLRPGKAPAKPRQRLG